MAARIAAFAMPVLILGGAGIAAVFYMNRRATGSAPVQRSGGADCEKGILAYMAANDTKIPPDITSKVCCPVVLSTGVGTTGLGLGKYQTVLKHTSDGKELKCTWDIYANALGQTVNFKPLYGGPCCMS